MKTCKTKLFFFIFCFLSFIQTAFSESLSFAHSFNRDFDHNDFTDDVFYKDKYSFYSSYELKKIKDIPLTVTPQFSFYVYAGPFITRHFSNEPDFFTQSPSYELRTDLSYGKIKEKNNFKEGFLFSFYPVFNYHFRNCYEKKGELPTLSFNALYKRHRVYNFFAINYRFATIFQINNSLIQGNTNITTLGRGLDEVTRVSNLSGAPYQTKTPFTFLFHMDMPFHLFTTQFEKYAVTKPLKLFEKLNFELQAGPFVEVALIQTTKEIHGTNRLFNLKDGFYSLGLEAKLYPESFKNISVRFSAGLDLSKLMFMNLAETPWRNKYGKTIKINFGFGSLF